MRYRYVEKTGLAYFDVPVLTGMGLHHRFVTKPLSFRNQEGESDQIAISLDRVLTDLPLATLGVYTGQQVHSADVEIVGQVPDTKEVTSARNYTTIAATDGLITGETDLALLSKYADCLPILLFDPQKQVQANIHSGWRGTLQRIGMNGLNKMRHQFGCQVEDIFAVLGPAIGATEFEVTQEVYSQFQTAFPDMADCMAIKDQDHWLIDIREINRRLFEAAGVGKDHLISIDISTPLDERCHSYRRDQADYGLMGLVSLMVER